MTEDATAGTDAPGTTVASAWERVRASPAARVLALGLASRILVAGVAIAGGMLWDPVLSEGWNRGPGVLRYLARWDSGFYMDIAQFGYGFKPESWAFDPGYPLAVSIVHALTPFADVPLAGVIVSVAAFLGALVLFRRLTAKLFDDRIAWRATIVVAFAPGTFYFTAVYADALFFFLLCGTFLAIAEERWLAAGLAASMAAITRPPGVLLPAILAGAIALTWLRGRRPGWTALVALPISAAMPAAFQLAVLRRTGNVFENFHAREIYWPNVHWHDPLTLRDFSGAPPLIVATVYLGVALCLLVAAFMVVDLARTRRLDRAPAYAFAGGMIVIYLAYADPQPILRYLLALVPLAWMVAVAVRPRAAFAAVVLAFGVVACVVGSVFARWGALY